MHWGRPGVNRGTFVVNLRSSTRPKPSGKFPAPSRAPSGLVTDGSSLGRRLPQFPGSPSWSLRRRRTRISSWRQGSGCYTAVSWEAGACCQQLAMGRETIVDRKVMGAGSRQVLTPGQQLQGSKPCGAPAQVVAGHRRLDAVELGRRERLAQRDEAVRLPLRQLHRAERRHRLPAAARGHIPADPIDP